MAKTANRTSKIMMISRYVDIYLECEYNTFVFICRFTDVILEADGQQYPAHKAVLCSRQGFRSVKLQKKYTKGRVPLRRACKVLSDDNVSYERYRHILDCFSLLREVMKILSS